MRTNDPTLNACETSFEASEKKFKYFYVFLLTQQTVLNASVALNLTRQRWHPVWVMNVHRHLRNSNDM